MTLRLLLTTLGFATLLPVAHAQTAAPPAAPGADCSRLAALPLPDTAIERIDTLAAGTHPAPVGEIARPICRVVASVGPGAVKLEIWLPIQGWNGKFQGIGNGGLAGTIAYPGVRAAVAAGYAAAATDTGHTCANTACNPEPGTDLSWFTNEQKLIHEMTLKGKALTRALYGQAPRFSYFNGCSTGGGQALINIGRYPQDYDGVLAGAPSYMQTRGRLGLLGIWQAANKGPAAAMNAGTLALVNRAIVDKCDARDGVADGIIDDPRACDWQPAELLCKPGQDKASCLAPAQVAALERIYSPLRTSDTGDIIGPAWVRGSEPNGWSALVLGDLPRGSAINYLRYMVFGKPDWDPKSFGFTRAEVDAIDNRRIALSGETFSQAFTAGRADIGAFSARGGKVLMYHGWGDADVTPLGAIERYEGMAAVARGRGEDTGKSVRLFMVPGMGHCRGGAGATDSFDGMAALEAWVERGEAPERIVASTPATHTPKKTRPLCAYPAVARWRGTGSTDDHANFTCVAPK
jgi:feruloyl esterase